MKKVLDKQTNRNVPTVTTNLPNAVRKELFLLVIEVPHCSGIHPACRDVHFLLIVEDLRNGLALHLALLSMLGFLWHYSKEAHKSVLQILSIPTRI